jgi:ABC-2 type transport system permease protein
MTSAETQSIDSTASPELPGSLPGADDIPMSRRAWVSFCTLVRKEITRFMRIWVQTIIPPAMTMTLYFVIFGKLIGSKIGDMDEIPYMTFIVPGLIMMSVIQNSYANVVSSFFSAKFQRHVEEMLVSPTPNWVILTGYVAGGVCRGLLVGFVVTLVSLFFVKELQINNIAITLATVLCTAILFSIGGFINAVFARKFDDVSIVPTFVLTPLTYLGGVFYSISLLPEAAQWASRANPILYMVNAFRYGILGQSDIDIRVAFTVIVGFIVVLFFFALHLLNKGHGIRS